VNEIYVILAHPKGSFEYRNLEDYSAWNRVSYKSGLPCPWVVVGQAVGVENAKAEMARLKKELKG